MFFDKMKNLRGILYKKVVEAADNMAKEPEITEVPEFSIKEGSKLVEFPEVKDLTTVNITYTLIEPFAFANIKYDQGKKELEYYVIQPKLDEKEKKMFKRISDSLVELVDVGISSLNSDEKTVEYLQQQLNKVLSEAGYKLTKDQYIRIMYYIYRDFVGYNEIEPLLQDPNIEDISCDGVETPIYVIHRKFGSIKTNVVFDNVEQLRDFIVKLAERAGRYVSYAEPILDGTLTDGSRVSATLAGDVATRGPTFTIRKFSEKPFSPVDQIGLGTIDANILAYMWYMVEQGASVLIVGGVATGKTSLLNTISMFIPPEAKIVSIEDTREIRLPHEHWIAGLARTGFGLPTSGGQKYGEVTLFDLLRESFRQNPDYVVVGEVRGSEAYVMFQGMSSGHPSMSTFHAGSIETVIKRLTTPPINLSPTLLESLDILLVMTHAREKGKSARRIKELAEIVSVDPKTDEVKTNIVFRWDPVSDTYQKASESIKTEKFATNRGSTTEDANMEIERRKGIILWMQSKGIKDFAEAAKYINMYYKEPEALIKIIGEGYMAPARQPLQQPIQSIQQPMQQQAQEVPSSKPVRKGSILEQLGFKLIRENK